MFSEKVDVQEMDKLREKLEFDIISKDFIIDDQTVKLSEELDCLMVQCYSNWYIINDVYLKWRFQYINVLSYSGVWPGIIIYRVNISEIAQKGKGEVGGNLRITVAIEIIHIFSNRPLLPNSI